MTRPTTNVQQPTASELLAAIARIDAEDLSVHRVLDWTVRTKAARDKPAIRLGRGPNLVAALADLDRPDNQPLHATTDAQRKHITDDVLARDVTEGLKALELNHVVVHFILLRLAMLVSPGDPFIMRAYELLKQNDASAHVEIDKLNALLGTLPTALENNAAAARSISAELLNCIEVADYRLDGEVSVRYFGRGRDLVEPERTAFDHAFALRLRNVAATPIDVTVIMVDGDADAAVHRIGPMRIAPDTVEHFEASTRDRRRFVGTFRLVASVEGIGS